MTATGDGLALHVGCAFLRDAADSLSAAHKYLRAAGGHEASAFLVDMAVLVHDLAHDIEQQEQL